MALFKIIICKIFHAWKISVEIVDDKYTVYAVAMGGYGE